MRDWPLWCSVFVAVFAGTLVAADVVRMTSLARDGKVSVSFELADAFTAEVRDAIHSGLPTTFTYEIELRRNVPFWPDRTLASAQIMVTVTFDNLTRRHQLSRTLNGHVDASETLAAVTLPDTAAVEATAAAAPDTQPGEEAHEDHAHEDRAGETRMPLAPR